MERFILNETSYFGKGARKVLISEIKKRHFENVLVVTDEELFKIGISNKITDGVVIALVYSDKNIDNWFDGKYHETVKSGIITDVSSDHRVIKQIDSKDAFKIYSSWNNKKLSEMKTDKLYQDFILHPLGIKTVDGSSTIIRQPISITENNGIEVNENVYINNGIIKMTTTKEELLEAPSFIIKQFLDNLRDSFT